MQSRSIGLKHYELTEKIISVFFDGYNDLGHGFLESVYQQAMTIALTDVGIKVQQRLSVAV